MRGRLKKGSGGGGHNGHELVREVFLTRNDLVELEEELGADWGNTEPGGVEGGEVGGTAGGSRAGAEDGEAGAEGPPLTVRWRTAADGVVGGVNQAGELEGLGIRV
jgi:hypothetical protein